MNETIRILQHEGKVVILVNGRLVTEAPVPWQAAQDIAKRITAVANLAQEWDEAERVISDGAVLARAGANIGLTSNARMRDEIRKEAAWNSELRRYMPGSVKSTEVFGRPTLIDHNEESKP